MARKRLKKSPAGDPEGPGGGGEFGALMARWGGIFCVSALMFALGVLTGRGAMPVKFDFQGDLDARLLTLKERDQAVVEQRLRMDAESLKEPPPLDFHEALKENGAPAGLAPLPGEAPFGNDPERVIDNKTPLLTKTPVRDRLREGAVIVEEDIRPAGPHVRAARPRPPEPARSPVREAVPPAAQQAEKKPMESAGNPGAASQGGLTVQVGSFKDPADADRLVAALRAKGYPAYKVAGILPEKGIWQRVRVGGFDSRGEADKMVARLKKDQFSGYVAPRN